MVALRGGGGNCPPTARRVPDDTADRDRRIICLESHMAEITLRGNPVHTSGELPAVGSTVEDFSLVRQDLTEATLESYAGKKKILNIYPSLDTPVCGITIKRFHAEVTGRDDVVILHISKDLPFAAKRFTMAEGIENAETLSAFRSDFDQVYGLRMVDGPLAGLCSRSVIVLDENNKVLYTEQVPEITHEPDYEQALATI
jgi:thiol peroxidase